MPCSKERMKKILTEGRAQRKAHAARGAQTRMVAETSATREEAIKVGARWYHMDVPCLHGHLGIRDTLSKMCHKCWLTYNRKRQADYPRVCFWGAKVRAREHNLPFSIVIEDVRKVWPLDNRCPVFGIEFTHGVRSNVESSPTLDRIIPGQGYVPGNIAVISYKANSMKRNETRPEAFRRLADWLENVLAR